MSLNRKNTLHTFSEGVQCELGIESYRNCISSMGHSETGGYEHSSDCQGIDLSMKQEKLIKSSVIKSENEPYNSCKSDAEDRNNIVVEVDPSIYSADDTEFCDFVCGDCGLQYPDRTAYETHCKTHNLIEPFKCVECSLRFHDYCSLDSHREIHLVKRYNCTDCKKKYSFKWSLMVHSQAHRARPQLKCEKCGLQFLNDEFYSSHLSTHQTVENMFQEDKELFSSKSPEGKHSQEYETNVDSVLDCEQCDLIFKSKDDLTDHQKMHSGSSMFKCETCQTSCASYSELREHVNSTHDDLDVHFCENCGGTGYVSVASDDDEPTNSSIHNLEDHCMKETGNRNVKEKSASDIKCTTKKTVRIKKSDVKEKHTRPLKNIKLKTKAALKKLSFEVTFDKNHSRKFCELKFNQNEPYPSKKRKGRIS